MLLPLLMNLGMFGTPTPSVKPPFIDVNDNLQGGSVMSMDANDDQQRIKNTLRQQDDDMLIILSQWVVKSNQ